MNASKTPERWVAPCSVEQPSRYPADDIVDVPSPGLDASDGAARDRNDDEDVPLDVQFTDALSMLAEGGHDYGRGPLVPEAHDAPETIEGDDVIDESSKDA